MAKSKKKSTRKKSKRSPSKKNLNLLQLFLKNERVKFIAGIFIAFIGIFIFLSIVSFFFTGAMDQGLVRNKALWELLRDKNLEVSNWTSTLGAYISETLVNRWFGVFSLLIPAFITYLGLKIIKVVELSLLKSSLLLGYGLVSGSIISAFILEKLFPDTHIRWGGNHGDEIVRILESNIGIPGMILVTALLLLVTLIIFRQNSMFKIQEVLINTKPAFSNSKNEPDIVEELDDFINEESEDEKSTEREKKQNRLFNFFKIREKTKIPKENQLIENDQQDQATIIDFEPVPVEAHSESQQKTETDNTEDFEIIIPKDEPLPFEKTPKELLVVNEKNGLDDPSSEMDDYDPRKDLSTFVSPSMSLLKIYNTNSKAVDMKEQNENKDKIITTLRNYGIEITSIKATVGPTITLYEIVPQAGVRISRIKNLEDDIALSLSALGIRIIAPMPGKGTIGIEVPNKDPQIVSMQSVIASSRFQECSFDLPVAMGKTITNEVFIFDLAKMPHLLVAGATGQGKSVGLNAIITSLLYKKHPSELKMVLVDPKMVEFNIYSTIEKHYLAKLPDEEKAIITDVSKVTQTLNSLTKEMDDRYELLMRAKVRNIKEYNEKFIKRRLNPNNGHRYLPYIVVVIDEFGDLIMTAGKEIEMPIARIAQKARAVGMHMVIATQRPTTNIITGTIKANFPARIAFRVTSQIDSRTILDATGANQLIGRGDMLFSQGNHLIRIQCAFVDTPEVEEIAQYIGNQRGYETAFALPEVATSENNEKSAAIDINDRDVLFDEAARLIVIHQQGSTSLIQRKFSIGYNRAGRLMDQLEKIGVVGPTQGSKPRDVYISDEYSLEKLLDNLK